MYGLDITACSARIVFYSAFSSKKVAARTKLCVSGRRRSQGDQTIKRDLCWVTLPPPPGPNSHCFPATIPGWADLFPFWFRENWYRTMAFISALTTEYDTSSRWHRPADEPPACRQRDSGVLSTASSCEVNWLAEISLSTALWLCGKNSAKAKRRIYV